jgi:hypothetical protein
MCVFVRAEDKLRAAVCTRFRCAMLFCSIELQFMFDDLMTVELLSSRTTDDTFDDDD